MIPKPLIIVIFNFIWVTSVLGASFSKVFVQSGAEVVPVEYVQYGSPPLTVANTQLAQISAPPVGSVVPLSTAANYLPSCGTPCVYSGSSAAAVAIQQAEPNYVTYKSSIPVVVASHDEPTGYEYSYIVYDENTGDRKSQREHSDGSVVRGEYSLIQPDGYVREVQYVADDVKGFNAIVKNFLPPNVEKKVEHKEKKDHGPPCHEIKNEPLKHAEHHEAKVSKETKDKSSERSHEKSSEESHEKSSEESEENSSEESHEKSSEESHEKSSKESHGDKKSKENHNEHAENVSGHGHAAKSSKEHSHEKPIAALTAPESHEAKSEEKHKDVSHEGHAEAVSSEEHGEELPHGENKSEHSKESKESHEENAHKSKESDESHEVHKESHEDHAESSHEARADNHEADGNILVSYNDIIKCVQSAIRKTNGHPNPHQVESPLTYIILNKPC